MKAKRPDINAITTSMRRVYARAVLMPMVYNACVNLEFRKPRTDMERLEDLISREIHQLPEPLRNPWKKRFEALPNEELEAFQTELKDYLERRENALLSLEFSGHLSEEEIGEIRSFDKRVKASYKNPELLQGDGGTAEVYQVQDRPLICVKFITNQERYNENNNIRDEFNFLSAVRDLRCGRVRSPNAEFLRMHPKEGHSFGMERVNGKNLSQLLADPKNNRDLIAVARTLDREKIANDLSAYVEQMHALGITHNDLHKRNIMLDMNGNVFVIDFGRAKKDQGQELTHMLQESDRTLAEAEIYDFFNALDKLDK